MPVPKRKTSKARRNKRSANKGFDVQTFTHCPNSGVAIMPHTVCLESGYYKGVKILKTKQDRLEERGKKRQVENEKVQAKQAAMQAQESAHSVKTDEK